MNGVLHRALDWLTGGALTAREEIVSRILPPKTPEFVPQDTIAMTVQEQLSIHKFARVRCEVCAIDPRGRGGEFNVVAPPGWKPGDRIPVQCGRCGGAWPI